MLPFVLPDIWGTCYQRLLAALSKCISPAARHSADRQRDVPMAPADTAAAQFTRQPRCQGQDGFCHTSGMLHLLPEGEKGHFSLPRSSPCLFCFFVFLKEKEGKRNSPNRTKNLKRKEIKKLGMRKGRFRERKIYLFYLSYNSSVICCSGRNSHICACLLSPALLQKSDKNNLVLGC